MRSILLSGILLLGTTITAFANTIPADTVPFDCDSNGAIVIRVTIDDRGPFAFLLDTGSSRSAVSDEVAGELGAKAVAQTEVVTPAGVAMRKVVRLGRMSVGNRSADGTMAMVLPAHDLRRAGSRIDGVLGQDFLMAFHYTLDFRRNRLEWGATSGPALQTGDRDTIELALVEREGRYLARLPQRSGRDVYFVPDTGASAMILFTRGGTSPLPLRGAVRAASVQGFSGNSSASEVSIVELAIGDALLRNQRAIAVDREGPDAPDADGLLPLHRFSSVTFDGGSHTLIVRK